MKLHLRDSLKPGYAHCGTVLDGHPEREGSTEQCLREHDTAYASMGEDLQAAFEARWCANCTKTALAWRR
jgi:hypothetical protein